MENTVFEFHSSSPDETAQKAAEIAHHLRAGDTVLLSGPIGSGKSHFCRSIIQTLLMEPEDVPSPTFTLVQVYDTRAGEIWHSDLYRLSDISEIVELGLFDAFETAICFVEWPDRLGSDQPEGALHIAFEAGGADQTRKLRAVSAKADMWKIRLAGGRDDPNG